MVAVGFLGRENCLEFLDKIIRWSPGDSTEVVLRTERRALTRFTGNRIHQNVSELGYSVTVRVAFGRRLGSATTNSLDDGSLKEALEEAARMARLQPPSDEFQGFPDPEPVSAVNCFYSRTDGFTAGDRARAVKEIVEIAKEKGVEASGSFSTGSSELAVGNSRGIAVYCPFTHASLSVVMTGKNGTGYAESSGQNVEEIKAPDVARSATEKCLVAQDPVAIPPGEYEVVLEPLAVASLLGYLARAGFSALAVREGRSFLAGRLGQKIFDEKFTMWDDGLDPRGFPVPFDLEGVPKRKVVLVDKGVATGLVYDHSTAKREGKKSTGHGGFRSWGPVPTNLFMATGDSTLEDMVSRTRKGVLVTRFHYTNMAHPLRVLVTGMTRDGTFLIEDGRIVRAVKNLRFTESALRVFSSLDMVGNEATRAERCVVPAVRVPAFAFTGVTEF